MTAPISNQHIIDYLNTDFGIPVETLSLVAGGADMNATVYKAQACDQPSYFVKLKASDQEDTNAILLRFLHDSGIRQIVPPIKTKRIGSHTLTIFPFIEAVDGFNQNLTDDQWFAFGNLLRQIHELKVPPSLQIKRETYSPKWREAVRLLYPIIEGESVSNEVGRKLQVFMKEHMAAIHRLVDRAEQLAQVLLNESHDLVLCHSDIHGGNVLIGRDGCIYIIDWDEAMMAPKERDLMFIGGGVGNVWNNPHEEKKFYEGYGTTEVNITLLAYYRHERIVVYIAEYGKELLLQKSNNLEQYQQFIGMFKTNGVVEIAFSE